MHFGRMRQHLETETPQVLILTKLATARCSHSMTKFLARSGGKK